MSEVRNESSSLDTNHQPFSQMKSSNKEVYKFSELFIIVKWWVSSACQVQQTPLGVAYNEND